MNIKDILSAVDHTLLKVDCTEKEIQEICDDGINFGCKSVCIPPSFVKFAKDYTKGKIKVCTVIGFPNGYSTWETKAFEAKDAVQKGADEIDMVVNIGKIKDKKFDEILFEIDKVKESCGDKTLKVIIETCLLSEEEKIKMCEIVSLSKADFIKTSTGFSLSGAKKEDIVLFEKYLSKEKSIKAAGGISDFKDAEDMLSLGAKRLGTSRLVKILKNEKGEGY